MMHARLRTAGCPAAERNILTGPIAGVLSIAAPLGAESPIAQPRCPREGDRAVLLKRRRLVRDDFLGVGRKLYSHHPGRAGGRPINRCLVQPARGVDASLQKESPAPVSRASSQTGRTCEKSEIHSASEVRPLDFRDHIEVRG
jgi:hypothetical protein